MFKQARLQRDFFNQRPAQTAWSNLLVEKGFSYFIKPRERKHFEIIKKLELRPNDKVLDIGCGTGYLLARIEREFFIRGTGIDFSVNSIKMAKKWEKENLKYIVAEAGRLPFKNGSFDYVLCFDVLEHIKNQNKVLKEMARVLRSKGRLLIYTINIRRRFTWDWWLEKFGLPLEKWTAHYDKKLFSDPEKLVNKLKKLGLKKESLILYDSFFSLGLNELMTIFANLMISLKLDQNRLLGRVFLSLTTFFSKSLGKLFDWLDYFWKRKGWSNSFYIIVKN